MAIQGKDNDTQTAESPPSRLKRWWPLIALVVVVAALMVGELAFQWARHRGWTTDFLANAQARYSLSSFAEAPDGSVWFGISAPAGGKYVDNGVSRFDPLAKGKAWATYTAEDGLASDTVLAIGVDGAGVLWFGTVGGGVSRFDPLANGEAWTTYTAEDGLASDAVLAIAVDGEGAIWFGTGSGVSRCAPAD